MNDNNSSNRPRVIWKNGKCIICPPNDGTGTSGNARKAGEKDAHILTSTKSTREGVRKQNRSTSSNAKASKAQSNTQDALTPREFARSLKYSRGLVVAVIVIALISVTVAVLSVSLSTRDIADYSLDVQNESEHESSAETPIVISEPVTAKEGLAVCIDPGHGFDDVGTSNDELGVYEYEVVLNVGLKLRDKLENAGIKVYMTHDTNEPPPEASEPYLFGMKKRNGLANSLSDVDLYLSIHVDAYFEDPSVSGPRVYHMSDDKGGEGTAEAIAEKLEELDGEEVYVNAMTGMNSYQVLRDSDMPAVLVETGFLSNPEEAASMLTDEWIESIATALADAVIASFENEIIG